MGKEGLKYVLVAGLVLVAFLLVSGMAMAAGPAETNQTLCTEAGGAWKGTISGAACCGNDGQSENGAIVSDPTHPNGYLCLYDSASGWQWLLASQYGFRIFSAGTKDKVSNKDRWFSCDTASIGQGISAPASANTADQHNAAKFTCANMGEGFRYTECCVPGSSDERACQNIEAKRAVPGDASTALIKNGLSNTFNSPNGVFSINSLTTTNWNAFSNLSIIYKANDPNISVEIVNSANQVIFSAPLMQYSLNAAAPNKWIHARIPVQLWQNISSVNIRYNVQVGPTQIVNNIVVIDSMFFVPRTGNAQFCSGTRFLAGSVDRLWLDDIDLNSPGWNPGGATQPAGESACNGVAAFGWTGSKCCGDDIGESFIDSQGGCWRGETARNGNTVPGLQTLLYQNQSFLSCGYGGPGTGTVNSQSCSVYNNYFCSVNNGWSNETISGVPATSRNTLKSTPLGTNLLRNPSFDEVQS